MKLFQIVIDYSQIPAAWKTPLTSEVYGPFRTDELSQEQATDDFHDLVRAYCERCGYVLDSEDCRQAVRVEFKEADPVPEKKLRRGYNEWHSFGRAFDGRKINVEDD